MSSIEEKSILYRLKNLKDHSVMSIDKDQFKIGRATTNDLAIPNNRYISSSHCYFRYDGGHVYLHDTSSNGTLINRTKKISKNVEPVELQAGDIIHLVFRKDEPQENIIFQLDLSPLPRATETKLKRKLSESPSLVSIANNDTKENADLSNAMDISIIKDLPPTASNNEILSTKMGDDMEDILTCACCQDLMNDPICLEPCLHAFCNHCYSSWEVVQRSCPKCRVKVTGKKKNVMINSILDAYLKAHPHKRPTLNPIDNQQKTKMLKTTDTHQRIEPRAASTPHRGYVVEEEEEEEDEDDEDEDDEDDESDERMYDDDEEEVEFDEDVTDNALFVVMRTPTSSVQYACRQCPTGGFADASVIPTGFQCSTNQNHILCQCCLQPMPDRQDVPGIDQSCELCHQHFCHMYYEKCQRQGCLGCLNQLRNFDFSPRHLTNLVNDNPVETQIVQNYLTAHRMTTRDLLTECCQRLDRKEFHCTEIDRNAAVPSKKVFCYKCALKMFKQLAYQFRVSMRAGDIIPINMRNRENCYYGRQCRTQYTKPAHAQKLNHACEQTRF